MPAATMFQPHSLLWHYLDAAPCILLLLLAVIIYRRSLHREFPIFLIFAIVQGVTMLALYVLNVTLPLSWAPFWWKANFVHLLIEVALKFAVIGEIFSQLLKPPSQFAPVIANSLRLDLADYVIQCGMLLCILLFAAYFHLAWGRLASGIALGLGLAGSVQLGTWAVWSNLALSLHQIHLLDFVNMGVYHVSVLIWFYYVLTTPKVTRMDKLGDDDDYYDDRDSSGQDLSGEDERQHDLVVWNRELERLLKR
ncbi:MAG: hypothetical protein ABR921_18640 [Candidatus Sulfotelmatobacter sp.]